MTTTVTTNISKEGTRLDALSFILFFQLLHYLIDTGRSQTGCSTQRRSSHTPNIFFQLLMPTAPSAVRPCFF